MPGYTFSGVARLFLVQLQEWWHSEFAAKGTVLYDKERKGFSRNLVWIIILSTTFPVLFFGYSLVVVFSSAFFFCEKKKQKTLHKRNCRKFPLLVPQECV
ncbi:MAG: hypothetical protein IKZ37_03130, partial [Bacteroidaceae bacterium]|nr:hypothetical protein [Bacteroidaceae bacterium]